MLVIWLNVIHANFHLTKRFFDCQTLRRVRALSISMKRLMQPSQSKIFRNIHHVSCRSHLTHKIYKYVAINLWLTLCHSFLFPYQSFCGNIYTYSFNECSIKTIENEWVVTFQHKAGGKLFITISCKNHKFKNSNWNEKSQTKECLTYVAKSHAC